MEQIATEINNLNTKIDDIEYLLKKPFKEWSVEEHNMYGDEEQEARKHLRKKEEQIREEKNQLRKKEEQLRELLILKEKEKQGNVNISGSDFIYYIPPKIEFALKKPKGLTSKRSGPQAHPKEPKDVLLWDEFFSNAESFHLESSPNLISPPNFIQYDRPVFDEIDLQGVINANILNTVNYLLRLTGSNLSFSRHSEIEKPILKGWPDHVLHKNNELMSFMETKTIWDLPTPLNSETIIQWWNDDVVAESSEKTRQNPRPSIFHIIGQVYGYLANHELKYGMLINGEVIWFLCRPNLPNAPTTLLISPPISLVGKSPTLFQSIMYFISLVVDGHKSGHSPETSPTDVTFPIVPFIRGQDVPDDLDLSQLTESLGNGFCGNVLKYTMKDGTEIALKCCDINNNKDGFEMMKNEVKIYNKLQSLQGTVVPTLRFSGFLGEVYLIGTELIKGQHLQGNNVLKKKVIKKLTQKLAQCKIEHGDLRDENILQDESGKYWILDFGKSREIGSIYDSRIRNTKVSTVSFNPIKRDYKEMKGVSKIRFISTKNPKTITMDGTLVEFTVVDAHVVEIDSTVLRENPSIVFEVAF